MPINFLGCKLTEEPFVVNHWSNVDIFNYFSHHMVTIPPATWINNAHLHGTKIIGTFITEWNDGVSGCSEFLKNEETVEQIVSCLIKVTQIYNFDGWLINIENPLTAEQVNLMMYFLEMLTLGLKSSDSKNVVIWYDSVLKSGALKWQNELNSLNKCFYDVCDGIFLNYNWNPDRLDYSIKMAGAENSSKIFVGIDCFDRGTFGGGGFNVNVAMLEIKKRNMSAALFAPGWLVECHEGVCILKQNDKFYNLISKYLPTRPIRKLPISTTFNCGFEGRNFCYAKGTLQPILCSADDKTYAQINKEGGIVLNGKTVDLFSLKIKEKDEVEMNLQIKCAFDENSSFVVEFHDEKSNLIASIELKSPLTECKVKFTSLSRISIRSINPCNSTLLLTSFALTP
uniref:Mannosyl-glycoprotein endo-beta-N-acetylglucosaminidase n=1 Tax=Rhabditophanes sp. KR3021 TaxID=114890 RepID=A0AC35TU28_9BILA